MKKAISAALAACLILTGCSNAHQNEVISSEESDQEISVDSSIYLDYSAGIGAGVYKWILSDDGDYYTLAAVDDNGEPVESEQEKINVGANNEEKGDFGQKPDGGMPDRAGKGQAPEGKGKDGAGFGGGGPGFGEQGTVYQGVYMNANITNLKNHTMLIYVPSEYMDVDDNGNVTGINHEGKAGNYTADTAPIVYLNECGGWRSSSPRAVDTDYIEQGMIYVTAGARSRDALGEDGNHTGKSPTQVVDLKSGIIALRANTDIIPGNMDRIVSIGTSGGGQMSSILGASGDMTAYYEYLYEAGAIGVTKNADGSFSSEYSDSIYAAQLYCPIADIEDADLAYAWWWVDLADNGGTYGDGFTEFDKRLQELEAEAFIDYLNSLSLKDKDGNSLTLTGLREGSYYDAILQNISDALNAMVAEEGLNPEETYPDSDSWLKKNADGTYSVTDMAGFMTGTGLVDKRNKPVPGFDAMDKSAENDAFGKPEQDAVHFSASVATVLLDNYDELSGLEGFDKEQVDNYIEEALNGEDAAYIKEQTDLLNATEILLGLNDGLEAVNPAKYWRDRSGTADQHTSFSIGYNICLAAEMLGLSSDYHLVWDMEHGNNEGTSTGTFIDWINDICG